MKTNEDRLVMISVCGQVSSPQMAGSPYRVGSTGKPLILPGTGGITYNLKVGQPATGWVADHVEPGVSIKHLDQKDGGTSANAALNVLSCIGNTAIVVSGDAKGQRGVVTGKHGGIEHVLVDFEQKTFEKMAIGDTVLVRAFGTGLQIDGFEDIKIMNLSPDLLHKMDVRDIKGKLEVAVTHVIPAGMMGSGIGSSHAHSGDYDIQLLDSVSVERYGLGDIKLGDIVAIKDADNTYGRMYRKGAISIGVVVHADCVTSGHGPGVTTIMSHRAGRIVPRIDPNANIGRILRIGIYRKKGARNG